MHSGEGEKGGAARNQCRAICRNLTAIRPHDKTTHSQ
jgi:hypothetical protein